MFRRSTIIWVIVAAACVAPVAVQAAGHTAATSSVTIKASPNPIVYGSSVKLAGKLTAKNINGVRVDLESSPYPYTRFSKIANTTTNALGEYTFTDKPKLKTKYRVMAHSHPTATSATILELVRMRVSLYVSDTTPARGARVVFSGAVAPPHDGLRALIQRRNSSGVFVTIATARLLHHDASKSAYHRTLVVNSSGTYRVQRRHDADHNTGTSRLIHLTVH